MEYHVSICIGQVVCVEPYHMSASETDTNSLYNIMSYARAVTLKLEA